MLNLSADKAAKGKDDSAKKRAKAGDPHGATGVEVGENAAQKDVQGNGESDLFGHRQPGQRPVQRIEHGCLAVGQKGDAQEQVGVPERQVSLAHRLGGIVSVWVKVGKDVHAGEDEVGEEDLAKENEGQEAQSQRGHEAPEASVWIVIYGCSDAHVTPSFVPFL